MNYFEFKKQYQKEYKSKKPFSKNPIKHHCYKILFSLEKSFNNIFDHYMVVKNGMTPNWLFDMFNEFVRLIENKEMSLKSKKNNALILLRNLIQKLRSFDNSRNVQKLTSHLKVT